MSQPYRVRFYSDLHVNSYWGIFPINFVAQGVPFAPTEYSTWLWENAFEQRKSLPRPDLVVVNGDLTHGLNRKGQGTGVYTQSQDIQNQAATEVVEMLVGNVPWFMVEGTLYHEPSVGHVAYALEAKPWSSGERYGQILDLMIRGMGVNIGHHPDGGHTIYKGTTMDRMSLWSIISAKLGKIFDAPTIVRSHVHFYALWQANGRTVVQTPCWTFPDPYAKKQGYFRYTSDIGCVDLLIERDEPYVTVSPHLILQEVPEPTEVIDDDAIRLSRDSGTDLDVRSGTDLDVRSGTDLDARSGVGSLLGSGRPEVGSGDPAEDDPKDLL